MRVRMLGLLRVRADGSWVPVTAPKQRLVLAVLLANAGRMVRTEGLAESVWGDSQPAGAANTIRAYVMRLRRLLGEGVLATRDGGYELALGVHEVDAHVFEELATGGRRALDEGQPEIGIDRLARALGLWRGPVFADLPGTPQLAGTVSRLAQLRLSAQEDHVMALLDLGRHAMALEALHRMVEEHPLRERRWVLLTRALYHSGRRADALEAFQKARRLLRDELGLEPGWDLQQWQRSISADGGPVAVTARPPAPAVVPAQLPPDVSAFTGRAAEINRLDALLPAADDPAATVAGIAVITGGGGIGKTALAVRWGHRVRRAFPDGQLYRDLRGWADTAPVEPLRALGGFLHALGVPYDEIPTDVDHASALYRSWLADRRVLVVLDNARSAEQVRPLLPGGSGCLALVTSRDRLDGLVARDGAVRLVLDVLTQDETGRLLERLLGHQRVHADPEATAELAALCGQLPLALRIAAATILSRPALGTAGYVRRLRHDQIDGLWAGGEGVRGAFDLSYATLPDGPRRLFGLLGLVPGPDITAAAAAALAGTDPTQAQAWLDQLGTAHLTQEHTLGRFSLHDLIRRYAAERARVDASDTARRDALDRLYGHYQRHSYAATTLLWPTTLRLPDAEPDQGLFTDLADASAWLAAEHANVVAAILHTAAHGPRQVAWRLADALRGYLYVRRSIAGWEQVARASLRAAQSDGHQPALVTAHFGLSLLHSIQGRYQEAIRHDQQAADIAGAAGWTEAQADALNRLGASHGTIGQLGTAIDYFARALVSYRQLGSRNRVAAVLTNLGQLHAMLGNLDSAADHLTHASAEFQQLGATLPKARAQIFLGEVYHLLGRLHDATDILTQALAVSRAADAKPVEANALATLAGLHRDLNDHATAHDLAEAACQITDKLDDPGLRSYTVAALASVHQHTGRHQHAINEYAHALTLARTADEAYYQTDILVRQARTYHSARRTDQTLDLATQALGLAREHGYRMLEGQALTVLAEVHLDQGKPELALDLAHQAVRVQTRTGHASGRDQAKAIADTMPRS